MDLQKMLDAMSEMQRQTRGQYQLTLGELIDCLAAAQGELPVQFAGGDYPGEFDSYRGYYSDLAICTSHAPVTVADLLKAARKADGQTFTGYKGGEYRMSADTPVWKSEYGSASGIAVMSLEMDDDGLGMVLKTKMID